MTTISKEQIVVLVALINAGSVMTAEQFAECKQVAVNSMMASLNGDAITPEEVAIAAYVTRTMQGVVTQAQKEADRAAKYAAAEAEYEKLMQDHRIALNGGFALHVAKLLNAKKEVVCKFTDLAELKEWFGTFTATLQAEPRKPQASDFDETVKKSKKAGTGTTAGTWNKQVTVSKLRDGSTLKVLWDALVAAGETGLTREAMEELMMAKFKERSKANNKFSVYEATAGRLPLEKVETPQTDGTVLVTYKATIAPEVELEIVETVGDAATEEAAK